jgi:hypothetical protein
MGASESKAPSPDVVEPSLNEEQLIKEHVQLEAAEQSEQKRIAGLIAELENEEVKLRDEMPCQDAQKATLECYQKQKEGTEVLNCGSFVDAYLHCTAVASSQKR